MLERELTEKELAFIGVLENFEDKWVAILRNGDEETVVGNGETLKEAKREAESRGFRDVVFLKIPSSHKIFIPMTSM